MWWNTRLWAPIGEEKGREWDGERKSGRGGLPHIKWLFGCWISTLSFLSWHFSRHTCARWCQEGFRAVGTQVPSVPPRHILTMSVHCPPARLSTDPLLSLFFVCLFFLPHSFSEACEDRRTGGSKSTSHPQNTSVLVNSKCLMGLVVILGMVRWWRDLGWWFPFSVMRWSS